MSTITGTEVKLLLVVLDEIAAKNTDLSPKVWYLLAKNQDSLNNAAKPLEVTRLKLVNKYGQKDGKTGVLTVGEDNMHPYREDFQKVLEEKIEVTLGTISLAKLEEEMKSMKGVNNIYLFYQHFVDGDLPQEKPEKKPEVEEPAEA